MAPEGGNQSAGDDPKTLGRARLSFASQADIEEFVSTLEKFERGELSPDAWRAFRLVRGTYGQRQDDVHMLRVKIPQGVLTAAQLVALADVAEAYSRGFGHITTRQNVQFHFLKLHDVEAAMRRLAADGLTTREACGNSVRNITCCPYAGVAREELFDVTPYAEALTRYLLRHPLSSSLPRKFKIAFEGCPEDHAVTSINDLGWRARVVDGRRGFQLRVGGGTATMTQSGRLLFEFLPAGEMFAVAEAVIRVFHARGDREHKHKNRLKFLIKSLGWSGFLDAFNQALAEIRRDGVPALPFDPENPPLEEAPTWARPPPPSPAQIAARAAAGVVKGPGLAPEVRPALSLLDGDFQAWAATNVLPQKQEGYATVVATVPLGDLTGAQMRILAELALAYGDGTARVTPEQDLALRWVRHQDVRAVHERLCAAGLMHGGAGTIVDVTSCPGAESCKLAVTQSRGLGKLLGDHLRARPDLSAMAPDLQIKISGCPNGCGQHHIAGLGFQGSVRQVGGKALPQYFVMVGGGCGLDGAKFARLAAKVPARRIPQALERLLALYQRERARGESATAFFQRVDLAAVKAALADLEKVVPEEARPEDFVDLGETHTFVVETSAGECAA